MVFFYYTQMFTRLRTNGKDITLAKRAYAVGN